MKYFNQLVLLLVVFLAQAMAQWQRCTGRPWMASCHQGAHWGHGGRGCSSRVMWWYDRHMRACRQIWYRGCGGNSNRWCTQRECQERCLR